MEISVDPTLIIDPVYYDLDRSAISYAGGFITIHGEHFEENMKFYVGHLNRQQECKVTQFSLKAITCKAPPMYN